MQDKEITIILSILFVFGIAVVLSAMYFLNQASAADISKIEDVKTVKQLFETGNPLDRIEALEKRNFILLSQICAKVNCLQ